MTASDPSGQVAGGRADADCCGSQLGLAAGVGRMGKAAEGWLSDPVPANGRFLPGSARIRVPEDAWAPPAGPAVVLDTPRPERLGRLAERVGSMPLVVNIDHHPSNIRWGTVHWVDPGASSTAELVMQLLKELGVAVDREIALCLYAGIVTDTGRFSYSNTTPFTHRAAAELIEGGADPGEIAERIVAKSDELGGRMAMRDLKEHAADWVEPVSSNYRGWDVWEIPPNGQGIAALQILNMLEQFDIGALEPNSAEHLHLFVEAKKLAFEDRAIYYADPEFADVPVA